MDPHESLAHLSHLGTPKPFYVTMVCGRATCAYPGWQSLPPGLLRAQDREALAGRASPIASPIPRRRRRRQLALQPTQ